MLVIYMFSMWSRVQLRSRWCLSALGNLHLPVFQKFLRHCQTKSSSVLLIGNGPFSSFWGRSPRASSCYTNSTNAESPKYCTPLLQQLHWLPISEWIKYKTACMCYNAITGSAPSYLSELLHLYNPSRSLRSSSDTRMLKIQRFNCKTHGFRTFSHFGPHIWNKLPQDFRHSVTLCSFKSQL